MTREHIEHLIARNEIRLLGVALAAHAREVGDERERKLHDLKCLISSAHACVAGEPGHAARRRDIHVLMPMHSNETRDMSTAWNRFRNFCSVLLLGACGGMATGCIETESAQPHQSNEVLHIEGFTNTPSQVIGFDLLDRRAAVPGVPPVETVIETPTYFTETGELVRGGPVRTIAARLPRVDASGRRTNQYPWSIDLQTTWLTRDDWV